MGRPRNDIMKHMIEENIALISMRQYAYNVPDYCYSFLSTTIVASRLFISNKGYCSILPLYTYTTQLGEDGKTETIKKVNLNTKIVAKITACGLREDPKYHEKTADEIAELIAPDLLDYIYAILYSPSYRKRYKEFLKIDFPRIPYPENADAFWRVAKLGGNLRQIHLLKADLKPTATYPISGNNVVSKVKFAENKVWINETQYFDNVSENAWNFYIGGYQPAQKWLKDRKDRALNRQEIAHYMKILAVLDETAEVMKEIDKN